MKSVVEEHPCLTLREVRQAEKAGRSGVWARVSGGVFQVRKSEGAVEVAAQLGEVTITTRVLLKARATPFGVTHDFLCPITGAPVRKLYFVDGRLGGRQGLGLDHLSHARPVASQAYRRQAVGQPKGSAVWGLNASAEPVSTLNGWERGRRLQLEHGGFPAQLGRDLHAARAGEIRSTRSKAIHDWGWTWMQAQLDCEVLDRLGLIEAERRHSALFSWELGHGDLEAAWLQTDLAGGRS